MLIRVVWLLCGGVCGGFQTAAKRCDKPATILFRKTYKRFLLFFWKKKNAIKELVVSWGQAPKPPGSASPSDV
jgi:hypothetical protein